MRAFQAAEAGGCYACGCHVEADKRFSVKLIDSVNQSRSGLYEEYGDSVFLCEKCLAYMLLQMIRQGYQQYEITAFIKGQIASIKGKEATE